MGKGALASEKKPTTGKRSRSDVSAASGSTGTGSKDPRFASAGWDPRFSRVPKKAKKAVQDERFSRQLKTNPGFRPSAASIDKFGRPKRNGAQLDRSLREAAELSEDSSDSDDEIQSSVTGRVIVDESSDESELDEDMLQEEEIEDIPRGRATHRLAVLGLDWSSTRAVDIFACLNAFCPPGKEIQFVEVHPSKFGLERLAAEAKFGPQVVAQSDLQVVEDAKKQSLIKEVDKSVSKSEHDDVASDDSEGSDDEDSGDESGEENDEEAKWKSQVALRKYEEDRLKYYYGVVQFEDVKAADAVYEQCDGVEYAQSGRAFDLRFIPNEMKIETTPRDRAERIPDGYAPPNVNPSALNNSNVKLTWDADDPDRVILKKKSVGKHELDEENLKAYLAGSSEEDEDEVNEAELKRKKDLLLGGLEEPAEDEQDMNMEITFEPGMLEKGEEIMKRKFDKEEQANETPWEARLRRLQERKAEKRRQRRELLDAKGDDDGVVDEAENVENDGLINGNNADFDSDPFFSVERDLDKEEEKERRPRKKKDSKKKNTKRDDETEGVDGPTAEEQKRKEAELELLLMDDKRKGDSQKGSMREMLAAVESDDDDDRLARRKQKKTRGKRRSQKASAENGTSAKPSAMDTSDPRFQNLFDSHLFAMDPTHPKFKQNETTQLILKEKTKRSKSREKQSTSDPGVAATEASKKSTEEKKASKSSSEAMELVARIKAKASARRKAKLKKQRSVDK